MNLPSGCLCEKCPRLSECQALEKEFDRFWEQEALFAQHLGRVEFFSKELLSE